MACQAAPKGMMMPLIGFLSLSVVEKYSNVFGIFVIRHWTKELWNMKIGLVKITYRIDKFA
jgi:hypothetical protein